MKTDTMTLRIPCPECYRAIDVQVPKAASAADGECPHCAMTFRLATGPEAAPPRLGPVQLN